MRLPRPRYTILSLMILVLLASLVLAICVAYRDYKRRRAFQEIVVASATANYLNAKLTREVAEIAVTEYTEGILKQDLEAADNEIALAKSDLIRAQERLAWARLQGRKGEGPKPLPPDTDKEARDAELRLQHARDRKSRLATESKEKVLKELQGEVARAKADELYKKGVYELEKAKLTLMNLF